MISQGNWQFSSRGKPGAFYQGELWRFSRFWKPLGFSLEKIDPEKSGLKNQVDFGVNLTESIPTLNTMAVPYRWRTQTLQHYRKFTSLKRRLSLLRKRIGLALFVFVLRLQKTIRFFVFSFFVFKKRIRFSFFWFQKANWVFIFLFHTELQEIL